MEPRILSIDTSCDETSAAVTEGLRILSNVIWSQASLHAKFGGVMPSLAKRQHQEHIDWVIKKTLGTRDLALDIDAIAVTVGPGLAIALEVGIIKAKELARKYNKPLIAVNHLEGHILSSLATPKISKSEFLISKQFSNSKIQISNDKMITFPAFGLVISGGNTEIVRINEIGSYTTFAKTKDDALGEALDKGARMLGLGYPGGAFLEKLAREGQNDKFSLPIPLAGREDEYFFSYSGLKTAMFKLVEQEKVKGLSKSVIKNLAYTYQDVAFKHIIRVTKKIISDQNKGNKINDLFIGGGVAANVEIRKRLRILAKELNLQVHFPYSKKLYGDNAVMIGIVANFKYKRNEIISISELDAIERDPRLKLDPNFNWNR
jgi:N6-L-threonylcarbamoyladenine synthase